MGHHANFTGFAAIGAVIESVHAQADAVLTLANAAIAVAFAIHFCLVANRANHTVAHWLGLPFSLYTTVPRSDK